MMARVIALHGSTGSGKSTLSRLVGEYLGDTCFVIQEDVHELLATSGSEDNQMPWYRRTTAIYASDNVTHIFTDYIGPLSLLVFSLTIYFLMGTVWPVVILLIGCLVVSRLCRWINCHILSKLWLYNVFLLSNRQKESNCRWVWRDRTCIDIYTYCLMNKATSVPLNMPSLLLEQTNTTSVAILLDIPEHIIRQHLRTRVSQATTSYAMAIITWLAIHTELPIRASIDALKHIERWYKKMNVPVIKISELYDKLDHDSKTGEIQWNKHSLDVLFQTIEQCIEQRSTPPSSTIDDSIMPWQIVKNSRLFHI